MSCSAGFNRVSKIYFVTHNFLHEGDIRKLASVVTAALSTLDHAGITAGARSVAGANGREELLGCGFVTELGDGEPATGKGIVLGIGHEPLDERAQCLGLGLGGRDALVNDE